jgi:hypothetical protein
LAYASVSAPLSRTLVTPGHLEGLIGQQEALGAALGVEVILEDDDGGELIDDLFTLFSIGDAGT